MICPTLTISKKFYLNSSWTLLLQLFSIVNAYFHTLNLNLWTNCWSTFMTLSDCVGFSIIKCTTQQTDLVRWWWKTSMLEDVTWQVFINILNWLTREQGSKMQGSSHRMWSWTQWIKCTHWPIQLLQLHKQGWKTESWENRDAGRTGGMEHNHGALLRPPCSQLSRITDSRRTEHGPKYQNEGTMIVLWTGYFISVSVYMSWLYIIWFNLHKKPSFKRYFPWKNWI